jgi:type II secretory pathway component GspD/PulD (secretin)/tetratricopeptide (TPR) repeat protein
VTRLALAPLFAVGGWATWATWTMAQAPDLPTAIAAVRQPDPMANKASSDVETVRQLVRDGRAALNAGDRAKAEKLARQAAAMKVALPFWETDTPEKLLIDIGVSATPPKMMPQPKTDPRSLMKMANDNFRIGKLDEARKYAQQAEAAKVTWGLFEKSPTKLLEEIQAAKAKKDKDESMHVLAEGRKKFKEGKLDEAEQLANKAQRLHGPYSVWDMGDRADKLIGDILAAKDAARKTKVPPTAIAKADSKQKATDAKSGDAVTKAKDKAAKSSGDAVASKTKTDAKDKSTNDAVAKNNAAKSAGTMMAKTDARTAPAPSWPTETTPKTGETEQSAKKSAPSAVPAAAASGVQVASATTPVKANAADRKAALRLMAEGKAAQNAGKYLEARAKFQEAKKLKVDYGRDDDTPDRCLMALSASVVKYCDAVCKESARPATTPQALTKCEAKLNEARNVALAFGLDCQPLESRLQWVKQVRGGDRSTNLGPALPAPSQPTMIAKAPSNPPAAAPATQTPPAAVAKAQTQPNTNAVASAIPVVPAPTPLVPTANSVPMPVAPTQAPAQPTAVVSAPQGPSAISMVQGQSMLEKARMELRRGQTDTARQLAIEVHNGPYGMQSEAAQVLRSIDVEEHNQRVLAANRNYDAGMVAFRSKDYVQANAIFRQVDGSLLAADRKQQFKEVLLASQKGEEGIAMAQAPANTGNSAVAKLPANPGTPAPSPSGVVTTAASGPAGPVVPASTGGITGLQGPKPAMTPAAQSGDTLAAQVNAMQEIEYQRLRAEGLEAQTKATAMFERGETEQAMELLSAYTTKVRQSKLDSASQARLQRPIDMRAKQFELLKSQKDFEKNVVRKKDQTLSEMNKEQLAQVKKQQQVKDLMKQFNQLYKEGKYDQAKLAAEKAKELDPDDVGVQAACKLAEVHGAINDYENINKRKEEWSRKALDDSEDPGVYVNSDHPVALPPVRMKIAEDRKSGARGYDLKTYSEKDKEIQARLLKTVDVNFKDVPLKTAIEQLRSMTGMNIVPDLGALAADGVSLDLPINLKVDNISLKAALNLMLAQVHLVHLPQDEVLLITTEKGGRGKQVLKVYSVADLVIPFDDYMIPTTGSLQKTLEQVQENSKVSLGQGQPVTNQTFQLRNGQQAGQSSMSTAPSGNGNGGQNAQQMSSVMGYTAYTTPTKQTMEEALIRFITKSIRPDSWCDVGGPGTIEYMPMGLALAINQTPDVQEQVAELLDALRRLQDVQIAVEVKMITLAETFFERVGLDFSLNIKTDKSTLQYEPQLVTNQFKPAGQVNDFSPTRFLAGLNPASNGSPGTFTSDLDIPIRNSSFQYAIPPFAFPNNPGFNGGLSLGLAFLSDIQVFMFMEAAQGDRRTNVMQAPKLTLHNGQTSTITVNDSQFFVTNVNVIGFGGQIVFSPTNTPFPLGVSMTIQGVVSADRRFVRLNISPTLTNLASAIVPLFPVTTFITPVFEGGAQGQPVPFTQFVQQPAFATVTIQTTVMVPDGGTVILGGLKTLSEGRNEFGPPVLSKLPYIDRLFRNVGYGREAQSLLLMVTPRVIVNAEEEERQTGVTAETPTPGAARIAP